jgi:hypothetical protein
MKIRAMPLAALLSRHGRCGSGTEPRQRVPYRYLLNDVVYAAVMKPAAR